MSHKSHYLEITNYKMSIQDITKGCVGHGLQSVSMRLQEKTRASYQVSCTDNQWQGKRCSHSRDSLISKYYGNTKEIQERQIAAWTCCSIINLLLSCLDCLVGKKGNLNDIFQQKDKTEPNSR